MNKAMNNLCLILLLMYGMIAATGTPANGYENDEGILVGRIAHIEGNLLRYVQEEKDWVITVKDAPFGLEDTLYSEDDSKAELIMPNGTWIRTGENTQLQLIALYPDATTVDVGSGLARLYNKSNYAIIKVTTPFGYVVAPANAVFDLYVGDESMEVIAVRGDLDFVHERTGAKHRIKEGAASIIADRRDIALGDGTVDGQWDDWNNQRDRIWAKRLDSSDDSANYLPVPIREESYVLEEYGNWERVYYEGAYHRLWRPTRINPGWRPFTAGRWTVYYGDNCWIPAEPFGYVTHHYGSWIYVKPARAWYWAPPIVRAPAGVPAININFGWYPGRVGWIHSGSSAGWVPLHPTEAYYGHRPWGHRTTLITARAPVTINISQYRNLDEAVIIPRHDFYRGTSYAPLVEKPIDRKTLINDYTPTTVINNTVIKNFNADTRRFSYNDAKAVRKPHATVISRITTNQQLHQDPSRLGRQGIEQDLTRLNTAPQPVPKAAALAPVLTPKLVDADKVAKPLQEMERTPKEIKPKNRERQIVSDTQPSSDRQPQSTRRPDRIDPNQEAGGQVIDRRTPPLREPGNVKAGQPANETAPPREVQQRGPGDRGRIDSTPGTTDQSNDRRIRSPREPGNIEAGQPAKETTLPGDEQRRGPGDRGRIDSTPGTTDQNNDRRIRSPREPGNIEAGQPAKETTLPGDEQRRGPGNRGRIDSTPGTTDQNNDRRIRSPGETSNQEAARELNRIQQGRQEQELQQRQQLEGQARQQQENQQRQQQEAQARQQQESQQRQQLEAQARQQQESQQRQQLEAQARQQQENQQRQQLEAQARQQQENQQRQQLETQARQQQENQQRQQQETQARQQQESQQRQQLEAQARQQQENQQRQQLEAQARQQQENQQRQQQETQARQQQENQQRQQLEAQKRQQLEAQQRQQQEAQARQQQELRQRQQQEAQARQQQELQQRQQQQEPQQQKKKKVPGQEQEPPIQPTQNQ